MNSQKFLFKRLEKRKIFCGWVFAGWAFLIAVDIGKAEDRLTPRQVVEQWVQVYPNHLEQAARMTTREFRAGVTQKEWITTQKPYLQNLRMKYVRAKIAHEEIQGQEAHVVVHAHIKTWMGDHPQDELYILIKGPEGEWLVDKVEIYTESFNTVP